MLVLFKPANQAAAALSTLGRFGSLGRLPSRAMSGGAALRNVHAVSQKSFTANHKLYDAVRSSYPEEAVACAASKRAGHDVLEVGAGTGKFTAQLVEKLPSTVKLTVAEPSPGMLKSFRKNLPQIHAVQAASTKLPFEDASFDTIYIAQAFHWFATRESLLELRRVLRPEGSLVLVWNYENFATMDPDGWQSRTTNLVYSLDTNVPQYRHMDWVKAFQSCEDLFQPLRERKFAYDAVIESPEFLWRYWASRSYITALEPQEQDALKQKLLKILDDYEFPKEGLVAKRGTHVVWTHPAKPEPEPAAEQEQEAS